MELSGLIENVFSRLNESDALKAIIGTGKVFGTNPYPPPASGPYVVIGDFTMDEGRLLNDSERVVYVTIHLWSSYKGMKEIIQMEQAVEEAMLAPPNPGGLYVYDSFRAFRDIEEGWMHGVLSFRVYIDRGF